jgi:pimeloyl-ACP methyl ester carboxylesterase
MAREHELRRSADRAVGVGGRALRRQQDFKDRPHLTVEEAKAHPEVLAGKSIAQVADHFETIIRGLDRKPAVVGHSFGGLLAQILAGRGLASMSVAIDPAPFGGVLPFADLVAEVGVSCIRQPGQP